MSDNPPNRPRILVVTPEITYLPEGMGNLAQRMCAKAGGLADVSASLVKALYDQGADVHVALPNYRRMSTTSSRRSAARCRNNASTWRRTGFSTTAPACMAPRTT